jgi:hypothetical protein
MGSTRTSGKAASTNCQQAAAATQNKDVRSLIWMFLILKKKVIAAMLKTIIFLFYI